MKVGQLRGIWNHLEFREVGVDVGASLLPMHACHSLTWSPEAVSQSDVLMARLLPGSQTVNEEGFLGGSLHRSPVLVKMPSRAVESFEALCRALLARWGLAAPALELLAMSVKEIADLGPEPRIVVVDDRLPCRGRNKLIFAGAPHDSFWVAIVEKATSAQPAMFKRRLSHLGQGGQK